MINVDENKVEEILSILEDMTDMEASVHLHLASIVINGKIASDINEVENE